MDVIEDTLNQLINATVFQIDVRPLLNGFESAIKNAGLESRAAAGAAREAAAAANATKEVAKEAVAAAKQTQEEVKKSAAAAPSTKAAPSPGWDDPEYWWQWWKATWYTPISFFCLGFALYQAPNRLHTVGFFAAGIFFHPYLGGITLLLVCLRYSTKCCRSTRRWIYLTPCGRYLCPRLAEEVERDIELGGLAMGRSRRGRIMNSTMYESAMDETSPPVGFWAYARSWFPFQYSPLGPRTSFIVWYV
jgi:hypothetical protein